MKAKGMMLAAMASMMAVGFNNPRGRDWEGAIELETKEEKERRLKAAELERNKMNGLKEFVYAEGSIWALNQKNADRKATKLGYSKPNKNEPKN